MRTILIFVDLSIICPSIVEKVANGNRENFHFPNRAMNTAEYAADSANSADSDMDKSAASAGQNQQRWSAAAIVAIKVMSYE